MFPPRCCLPVWGQNPAVGGRKVLALAPPPLKSGCSSLAKMKYLYSSGEQRRKKKSLYRKTWLTINPESGRETMSFNYDLVMCLQT